MKAYILLALCISVNSINFGQNFQLNDSIQVHYNTGRMGGQLADKTIVLQYGLKVVLYIVKENVIVCLMIN